MALNQPRRWLIAYDLRDHRRIARVHRLLSRVAVPVQYSVFAARGSAAAMGELARQIEALIDAEVDDVRMYPIPQQPLLHTVGAAMLPDDALLLDAQTGLEAMLGRGACPSATRIPRRKA
jgi:CRISPR-associated protein Cas2